MSDLLTPFFKYKKGWKIKPKLSGDPRYAEYVKVMAEEQRRLNPAKPKPIKPESMTREEWIFSMQAQSTQDIITKQKDPKYKRDWSEPLPDNVQARDSSGSIDINARNITNQEFSLIESMRRRSKNALGQSQLSSIDDNKKELAIDHFRSHPSIKQEQLSIADIERLQELKGTAEGTPASLPMHEWKKLTTWQAIKHWLMGGKIRRD